MAEFTAKGANILVVDDDDDIREIVHILLAREGFTVREAANAEQALRRLDPLPDLVILDVMMPGLSGIELCREIRTKAMMPILLSIDLTTGAAALAGNPLTLTETEAQLLRLLAQHRGDVLSAREIYEAVWKESFLPSANNTVMVHIKNLRKKLETDLTQPKYIHTVWGKGYYLA